MKSIGGYDFPDGTTFRASAYKRISSDGELCPLVGWEFNPPTLGGAGVIVEGAFGIEIAAKIAHKWLNKRGLSD